MKRGLTFEIPNKYGNYLAEILKPIDLTKYSWCIGDGESYKVVKHQLDEVLFSEELLDGEELKSRLEKYPYYIIFTDLKAYPKGEEISLIETYSDFKRSNCELVLLVVDSSYTTIYCKDPEVTDALYKNAIKCGFEKVHYITEENDGRTRLIAF